MQHASHRFNLCAESFKPIERNPNIGGLCPSLNGGGWPGVAALGGSVSPSVGAGSNSTSPVMGPFFGRPGPSPAQTAFTAATFAQTKFGSTKMKTQAQRPTRLSPTELSAGGMFVPGLLGARSPVSPLGGVAPSWPGVKLNQRSPVGNGTPFTQLSPVQNQQPQFLGMRGGDPRLDLMKEHQQRVMMFQQQQILLHQQQMHQQQQQQKVFNQGVTSFNAESPQGDVPSPSDSNSIAPSLQSLYEQQQKEMSRGDEVQPLTPGDSKSRDPFQTDPNGGQTALDLLDWNAMLMPYTGGLHQLLVAN